MGYSYALCISCCVLICSAADMEHSVEATDIPRTRSYDSDDSITITITESDADEPSPYSDPEDDITKAGAPNDDPTVEWLQYENARLRKTVPQLKQAISARDMTIKTMRCDAKKAAAIAKRHKAIIMDINKELAEAHKELLMIKGEHRASIPVKEQPAKAEQCKAKSKSKSPPSSKAPSPIQTTSNE